MLDELRAGAIHLTGLFLLSRYVAPENVDVLLAGARGKSRSELQELIARWFPRSDVAERLAPLADEPGAGATSATCAGAGAVTGAPYRLEPLSPSRYLVQFTASAEFHQKITQARELLSHVLPGGELAALFERAIDALLKREVQRRMGVGRPSHKRNGTSSASAPAAAEPSALIPTRTASRSRYVPRAVARAVWERDGGQCTFVDGAGRRCQERRFMTLEHESRTRSGVRRVDRTCACCVGATMFTPGDGCSGDGAGQGHASAFATWA